MRIGIDARMYGPKQTGIGNYIKYLIEYLARADKENTYYIFLREENYKSFTLQPSRFKKVLADFPWYSLAEQTAFLRLLSQYPLDVMHFPHFNVPFFYQKPFVVTIHDLTPKFFPGEKVGRSWVRRKAYELVLRHSIEKSAVIITPSQFTKDDILKYFSVNTSKIRVIHEGIPFISESPTATNYKPQTTNYILYIGVWRSHKNLAGLIKAFALLKKEGLPHKLVIIGDPDIYYERTSSLWKNLGLKKEVITPGFQKDGALTSWYKNASLLVLPSFYEGFGLTPLISLSLNVPVAVSDIGALREVLEDSAFFFDPSSPQDMARIMKEALTDKEERQRKVERARKLLKRYQWSRMAQETLRVYSSLFIDNVV